MNVNVVGRKKELQHLLTIVDPSVVIVQSADIAAKVDEALLQNPQLRFVLDRAADGEHSRGNWKNLEQYLAIESPQRTESKAERGDASQHTPDDIILLLSTSGTTSLPKGCPLSSRNLVSAAFGMGEVFEIDQHSVALNHMPLSHVFGFYFIVHYQIKGASVVHPSAAFDAASSIRAINDEKCTDIPGVPAVFKALTNHPTFKRTPTGQIRHVGTGATRILPADIDDIIDNFGPQRITIGYGLTETGIAIFTKHQTETKKVTFCVTPSCKVKICHPESGEVVGTDEAGEIHVGGEGVILEYWLAPEQEVSDPFYQDEQGRWMKTGDQGTMDGSGSIAITGRYKEIIIRGGENISPVAIEAALQSELKITAEVVGYPDEIAGEVPVAVLKKSADQDVKDDDIRQTVLEQFGPLWALSSIVDVTDLGVDDYPRTASGKVQKQTLKQMVQEYLDEQTKAGEASAGSQDLDDTVCATWATLLGIPRASITSTTKVTQLTDSLIIAKFPSILRKRLPGAKVSMQDILDNPTISAQVQLLERSGGAADHSKQEDDFEALQGPARDGPPTINDVIAAHGDSQRFAVIQTLCEATLKPLGLGWHDVQDVIPAHSYLEHFLRRTRDQVNTHRYSWSCRRSAAELRQALQQVLEKYATMRSVAIKQDGQVSFVAIRPSTAWFSVQIAGNEEVGKAETVQEFTDKALEDPIRDVVAFPGPLTRFVICDIVETGGAGVTMTSTHAAFDGISLPMFVEDLDATVGGQSVQELPERLPYKLWADSYYALQETPLAQEAVNFHVTRLLKAGIASLSASLYPFQRTAGWFTGSTAGWPPAAYGAERKRLEPNPETPTPQMTDCQVPHAPEIKRRHGIETVVLFKAAVAILNARRTRTSLAAFTSYQAARSWPFLPEWQAARMPSAMSVQGPTVQVATNVIPLAHDETILALLQRLQAEQELITKHGAAPFGAIHARLNKESPGAGEFAYDVWKRQIFNWLPPWDPPEHLKMERAVVRNELGLLWRLLPLPGGEEVRISVFYDNAQLTSEEAEGLAKEMREIAETVSDAQGLDRKVGDVWRPSM
ncbi:hypothetical protein LTR36_006799 [Oleoguttula mirabilis]|uniref:Carrier domain-containing protein n=1 Tax=Oleoguttula mirabilis TaxID=1507867 RepID=A0AAV9JBC1_9PEZI|nr:hypothetical protein LTR36_006799 [Oleoguttula mirabilis]